MPIGPVTPRLDVTDSGESFSKTDIESGTL